MKRQLPAGSCSCSRPRTRTGNPTRSALEECLAALEGGKYGRAFASGMAATDAVLRATMRPGDHMVIPDDAYGGTFRLIDKVTAIAADVINTNTPVAYAPACSSTSARKISVTAMAMMRYTNTSGRVARATYL